MPTEPSPSPEPEPEELVLQHPPLPHILLHTGGQSAMDMTTAGFVDEARKGTCDKCTKCLCERRRTEGAGE